MPNSATNQQSTSRSRRLRAEESAHTLRLIGEPCLHQEIQSALDAIPADSVTARTAGALRVASARHTIADERAAFEQAVAEENARQSEG